MNWTRKFGDVLPRAFLTRTQLMFPKQMLQQHIAYHVTTHRYETQTAGKTATFLKEPAKQQRQRTRQKLGRKWDSSKELEDETEYYIAAMKQLSSTEKEQSKLIQSNTFGQVSMQKLNEILEAWMQRCLEGHGIQAAQQGLRLLEAMEANFDNANSSFYTPSTSFYDIVFHAFVSCKGGRLAAETVQIVFQNMLKRARSSKSYPQPTSKTFNIVLNCWAKSNEYDAGLRAEELWRTMKQWHDHDQKREKIADSYSCAPNARTMATLVEAWGNSGHEEASKRVLNILQQATEETLRAKSTVSSPQLLNVIVFTNAIRAVTRPKHHQQGTLYAEKILNLMEQVNVQPNTRTYAAVLHAYAKMGESKQNSLKGHIAQRTTAILEQMIEKYRDGASDVKPNVFCFTTCIAAWARCRDVTLEPQHQAEKLWNQLIQLYLETSDADFRPSVETGNAVLMVWMRATHVPNAIERGHEILERMQPFAEPDLRSYNTLLNGMHWRGMGEQAVELLEWMEQQGRRLQPDSFSFNTVLAALAKDRRQSNTQQSAENILRKMEHTSFGADQFSYATVLDAWARSEDNDKACRAEALVQIMIDRHKSGESKIKPDIYIFSNLIKACIPCKPRRYLDDEQSRNIALRAMEVLKSGRYGLPNYVSYMNLLRVVVYTHGANQHRQRQELLSQLFVECVEGGHVSSGMVDILRASEIPLPPTIPASWSRSVLLRDRPTV